MSDSEYYIGEVASPLDTEEHKTRLVQRLRQYLVLLRHI
jgi:hypothetical protein